MMTETTVTMARGCCYCKWAGVRIDLVVSVYRHLYMGKKKKKTYTQKKNTLLYKIAKSTGMKRCKTLTIVLLRIIQEKRKLSLKEVVMFGLPEQLLLEI